MSLYYTEDIQMVYDDHAPLKKSEKIKTKVTPINTRESADNQGNSTIYQVIWIDSKSRRFDITVRVSSDLIIKDFLQMVIGEYNQLFKREEIDEFFFTSEFTIYELYEIDEDGKPDEELPAYDDNQKLRKISSQTFGLKQTVLMLPSLMVSSMSDPQSCKSPISPRSEEEKINPLNKTIQYTENTIDSDKGELVKIIDEREESKFEDTRMWCFCCCQF